MGFFREFREEFKVQAFVSRVEHANYKFRTDFLRETTYHLTAAKKAFTDIQASRIEHKLTKVGWGGASPCIGTGLELTSFNSVFKAV